MHWYILITRSEKKNASGLREGPMQVLDDTLIRAGTKCSIDFTELGKRFVLSLYHNQSNRFLFVNATKIYQLKAKDSEIRPNQLCLGNISKYFTIKNMKKKKQELIIRLQKM